MTRWVLPLINRPDLVIADLRLPDGDGLDVVRAARKLAAPPPVIVVTGHPSEVGRAQAMQAGAAAFLAKPFALAALVDLVQRALPISGFPPPVGSAPSDGRTHPWA
jgi:DNA-binding response OmpR family regulator